ncbi:hypothetical protein DFO69_2522 [Bacillus subtilis]|nr:hypothetical protein DFO69_2522 [Bacillus subtilis]
MNISLRLNLFFKMRRGKRLYLHIFYHEAIQMDSYEIDAFSIIRMIQVTERPDPLIDHQVQRLAMEAYEAAKKDQSVGLWSRVVMIVWIHNGNVQLIIRNSIERQTGRL